MDGRIPRNARGPGLKGELAAVTLLILALAGILWGTWHLDSTHRSNDTTISLVAEVPTKDGWQPNVIRAKVGEPIRLRLTSVDVTHGFLLPEFGIDSGPISPGEFTTIEFVPDRSGTFKFYCNILCSLRHGGMTGQLVVEAN
jgi:heme/copper-type cytochrome/quinol oxidase subunit 2